MPAPGQRVNIERFVAPLLGRLNPMTPVTMVTSDPAFIYDLGEHAEKRPRLEAGPSPRTLGFTQPIRA